MKRAIAITAVFVALAGACTRTGPGDVRSSHVTITLLTHDSFDVTASVLRRFEAQSGITVKVVPVGDAGQLVNRAILSAGNPEGDVLFGIDNNQLSTALAADVFLPYTSPRLAEVDPPYELDPQHRVTPVDHGEVCINDDKAFFDRAGLAPPQTLEDLVDPRYRGMLVVENPATSTPGLAFLLATIAHFGPMGWEDYWRSLRANDVLVVDGWESAYYGEFSGAGGGEGTHPLVVSYASSPVAEMVFAETPLTEPPTGVMESSCFRQIELAGILRGTQQVEAAQQLVDFLLSTDFQNDIPLRMFVYPVTDDATLPEVFAQNAVVPASPLSLPAEQIAANHEDWVQRWTDIVLR